MPETPTGGEIIYDPRSRTLSAHRCRPPSPDDFPLGTTWQCGCGRLSVVRQAEPWGNRWGRAMPWNRGWWRAKRRITDERCKP